MDYRNALYDTTLNLYLCPECNEQLEYFCESPAEYLYCPNNCEGACYDTETGEYTGDMEGENESDNG